MKAIVVSRFGGPEVLELGDREAPPPGRGEVRVRVRAAGVNRADLLQRAGHYPAPADAPPDIPGLEFAGELEAVGEGVTDAAPGDRVLGLCGGGAYAEAITVPARTVARLPDALTFTDGAAIPEAFITAWDALVEQAHLGAGETVLIHAVGSGVGTAAVQVARVRPLGLDEGVHVTGGGFAPAVLRATGGRGADVVLDLVGGPYLSESLACVAARARIMLVGLLAGPRAELDLGRLLRQRVQVTGTVLRARPLEEKIAAVQQMARHLLPLFERGALGAVVDRVFPLAEAAAAHAHVASNGAFGKVVLAVP